MDNGKNLVLRKNLAQRVFVAHVRFKELHFFAAQIFNAVYHQRLAVYKVIHDRHIVALFKKRNAGVAANVACAARNQNSFHKKPTFLSFCLY